MNSKTTTVYKNSTQIVCRIGRLPHTQTHLDAVTQFVHVVLLSSGQLSHHQPDKTEQG